MKPFKIFVHESRIKQGFVNVHTFEQFKNLLTISNLKDIRLILFHSVSDQEGESDLTSIVPYGLDDCALLLIEKAARGPVPECHFYNKNSCLENLPAAMLSRYNKGSNFTNNILTINA